MDRGPPYLPQELQWLEALRSDEWLLAQPDTKPRAMTSKNAAAINLLSMVRLLPEKNIPHPLISSTAPTIDRSARCPAETVGQQVAVDCNETLPQVGQRADVAQADLRERSPSGEHLQVVELATLPAFGCRLAQATT